MIGSQEPAQAATLKDQQAVGEAEEVIITNVGA
jgi:hypothetical protein